MFPRKRGFHESLPQREGLCPVCLLESQREVGYGCKAAPVCYFGYGTVCLRDKIVGGGDPQVADFLAESVPQGAFGPDLQHMLRIADHAGKRCRIELAVEMVAHMAQGGGHERV